VTLIVRLTRLSPTHHRFEAVREDGAREARELETRSFLAHDLVHFALESEAGLDAGFYAALARGAGCEAQPDSAAAMQIEGVVGPLQGAVKGDVDPETFVAGLRGYQESIGVQPPDWLTPPLIARVLARMRQLQGQWRATPFGETMELRFDA
jgi:hypothetical protein